MDRERWAQVKEIFNRALEMEGDERALYLEQACNADEELFLEVNTLFDAHLEAGRFIESPAIAPLSSLVDDTGETSRLGQVIGAYKIEKEVGRGGMGAVYLASRADQQFKKKVAIKLIKRGLDTDEIIKRFRHERQILATLEHPFITRLIDGGATDDGLPYLVMEYVEGLPLAQYCNEDLLSINERLALFLQICSAVQYAHRNLIVHRDLKPSNILIQTDGTPRLLDFGIAKLTTPDAEHTIENTVKTFHAMTPEYASPEQVMGGTVTTASDIYSLGVILYELLTGHRPFRLASKSTDEISRIISETPPTKPSSVCRSQGLNVEVQNPHLAVRKLRGELDNIILMAMRKEPERRYSTVEQFGDDIQRYLKGLPVIAQEDTLFYHAEKFVKRNKAGVAAGVGIAVSLIAGLMATSRQARISKRQRDKARQEAEKARKINQFLQKMLSSADPRVGGKDVKIVEVLDIAAEDIEAVFANEPDIVADLESTIGLTFLGLGQLESAEQFLKNAFEIRKALFPRSSVEMAQSLHSYGKLLHARGSLDAAEPLYRESLNTFRHLKGNISVEVSEVLDDLGYLLAIKGDIKGALVLHEEELEIRTEIYGENHVSVARCLEKLGSVYSMLDRREVSEPILRRSMKILQTVYGMEHPDVALLMVNLAGTIHAKCPDEAEQLCQDSLAIRRKLLGEDHVDVCWSLYNLAYVLIGRGRSTEALEYLALALSKRGSNLPDEHPVVSSCLLLNGRALMLVGEYQEAKSAFEECLSIRLRTLPEDHWLLATTKSFLGECLVTLGDAVHGKQMMAEGYQMLERRLGKHHDQTVQALDRLARIG